MKINKIILWTIHTYIAQVVLSGIGRRMWYYIMLLHHFIILRIIAIGKTMNYRPFSSFSFFNYLIANISDFTMFWVSLQTSVDRCQFCLLENGNSTKKAYNMLCLKFDDLVHVLWKFGTWYFVPALWRYEIHTKSISLCTWKSN